MRGAAFLVLIAGSIMVACGGAQTEPAPSTAVASSPADLGENVPPLRPGEVTAVLEGDTAHFVIRITTEGDPRDLVDVPVDVERWDQVRTLVSEVRGSGGRLVLVQLFGEVGEDEFTRDLRVWVIDRVQSEVIWSGQGSYSNSFGECERLDVPEPVVEEGELVVRATRGVSAHVRGSVRCMGPAVQRVEVTRIPLEHPGSQDR